MTKDDRKIPARLQTIPINTPLSLELRKAFEGLPGRRFVIDASEFDYADLELRVAAAMMNGYGVVIDLTGIREIPRRSLAMKDVYERIYGRSYVGGVDLAAPSQPSKKNPKRKVPQFIRERNAKHWKRGRQ